MARPLSESVPKRGAFQRLAPARMGQIVVVESIYHQAPGDQPKLVENGYILKVSSNEQPYGPRRKEVADSWAALDIGWAKDWQGPALLALKNLGPAEALLEFGVTLGDEIALVSAIPTGQSLRLPTLQNLLRYRVRCRNGKTNYSITLFPGV